MSKHDDFDLDVQNTTTHSNAVQPNTLTPVSCLCSIYPVCTALCLSSGCSGVCPGPTYDYNCK